MQVNRYKGGSCPELTNQSCRMLYKVIVRRYNPQEPGAVTTTSFTVANLHNAVAFEAAAKEGGQGNVEVSIVPDTLAYLRKEHPELDLTPATER